MNGSWVPRATRDAIVRFVHYWTGRPGIAVVLLVGWLGITTSKFSRRIRRLGTPNQHNASVPRDFWLEDWEKATIVAFHDRYPLEGYQRLTYMMLDADVVSPSSVYRVLKAAGLLSPHKSKPFKKGTGFQQPLQPHEHGISTLRTSIYVKSSILFAVSSTVTAGISSTGRSASK